MRPLVSVVIPSFNHERFLGQAISSVLEQSYDPLELVIVDDGSTDGSREILSTLRDRRVRIELQANAGAHAAINRGLGLARGELIAILNSDDRFAPNRLARAVAAFDADPRLGLWGSYLDLIDELGLRSSTKKGFRDLMPVALDRPELSFQVESDLRLNLLVSNYWSTTSNFVFSRRLLDTIGPMEGLRFAHDWDFAFRALRTAPALLEPTPLLEYRLHGNNTIRQDRVGMVFEILWVLARHLPGYAEHAALDLSGGEGTLRRLEQLRYSLQPYGCWRTFACLGFLMSAAEVKGTQLATALLSPSNPTRRWLMAEVANELAGGLAANDPPRPAPRRFSALRRQLRRLVWNDRPSQS